MSRDTDTELVNQWCKEPAPLLPLLHAFQNRDGCLTEAAAKGEQLTRRVQTGFDPETGKPIFEDQELPMEPLPFIVIIVDEMADLMLVAGKDVEAACNAIEELEDTARLAMLTRGLEPRALTTEQVGKLVTKFDVDWE